MDKWIHKQDNGLMAYFQKLLESLIKKMQVNSNQDGFYMMVMLMQYGYKIWIV
jgi:hypothetical protein